MMELTVKMQLKRKTEPRRPRRSVVNACGEVKVSESELDGSSSTERTCAKAPINVPAERSDVISDYEGTASARAPEDLKNHRDPLAYSD